MTPDPVEKALDEIDRVGDVGAQAPHHPAAIAMWSHLVGRHMAVYDPDRMRYVLTGTGRQSLARIRKPPAMGVVAEFRPSPGKRGA